MFVIKFSSLRRTMNEQTPLTDSDIIDGLSIRYLKFFGLWKIINDYRTTGRRNALMKIQMAITLTVTVPYIFCQLLSFFMITMDLQKITFVVLLSMCGVQICCEVLMMWFRLDSQCRFANLMKKDFIQLPEHKKPAARKIFKKIAWKFNLVCIAALIIFTCYNSMAITCPDNSVEYILHHKGNMFEFNTGKMKVMGGWYPLPFDRSPYYEIVYFFETISVAYVGTYLGVYICLFYQTLVCLYAQFAVLGIKLSTLSSEDDGEINEKPRKSEAEMYKELITTIKHHQELLSYADEIRAMYNPLVTMIVGPAIFILIFALFQMLFGTTASTIFIVKSIALLPSQAIQVCMFCFASSYLETASSDIQFAIYSSDWYKANIKFRKAVQMMMLRAKKGETLKAVGMYPINVETMVSIFQLIYGVSAMMMERIK